MGATRAAFVAAVIITLIVAASSLSHANAPGTGESDLGAQVPKAVSISPAKLNFGKTKSCAKLKSKILKIKNDSKTATLSLTEAITGIDAEDFAVIGGTCMAALLPSATCTYELRFDPAGIGTSNATMQITDSPDPSSPHEIPLSGKSTVICLTPTPTATVTATITATPTITVTSTRTATATPTATATVTPTPAIFVNNNGSTDVLGFLPVSNGNVVPAVKIIGADTGLDDVRGIAADSSGNIYVANYTSASDSDGSITIYPAGGNNDQIPSVTISGSNTKLHNPIGIALDSSGNIYVADNSGSGSVTVYPAGSSGNAAPSVTITGTNTGLSAAHYIALDSSGKMYVTDGSGDTVNIFSAGATGNVAPIATISGPDTGLQGADGIAVDSSGNIYVVNNNGDSVTVYPPDSNGDETPSATISGADTGIHDPIGIALDSRGNIYVASTHGASFAGSVTVYPPGSNGDQVPITNIAGSNTSLNFPHGIALLPPGAEPTPTPTQTATATATRTSTLTPTTTRTSTTLATPSSTHSATVTPTNVATPTATATRTPTITPTRTATPTATLTRTGTPTATHTTASSATATPSGVPTTITISGKVVQGTLSGGGVTPDSPVKSVVGATVWLEAAYILSPTPTVVATPTMLPTPTSVATEISSPLYLIKTTTTDGSGNFSFSNIPTYGSPNSFVVVADSNSLPSGGAPSNATVTGPLQPTGLLTGLEIPLVPATNSNASSLQGMFSTMGLAGAGAGDDVTFVPAQPVIGATLYPGYNGTVLDVDALVPPLASPNGVTNGTQNGTGGAPYLTTSTNGSDNGCGGTSCPADANCACFSIAAPNGNPISGAPSANGTGYTQPTPPEGCEANPTACYATYFWAAETGSLSSSEPYGNPDCPDLNSFCSGNKSPLQCCTGVGTGTCNLPVEQPDDLPSPFQLDELNSVTDVPDANLPSATDAFSECQ